MSDVVLIDPHVQLGDDSGHFVKLVPDPGKGSLFVRVYFSVICNFRKPPGVLTDRVEAILFYKVAYQAEYEKNSERIPVLEG